MKIAHFGGKSSYVPERKMDLPLVENAEIIAKKIKKIVETKNNDGTKVELINEGKQLLVQLPKKRLELQLIILLQFLLVELQLFNHKSV